MRKLSLIVASSTLLALMGTEASALGFTRGVNSGHIGGPLNFAAFVRVDASEELLRECVFADAMVGDRKLPSGQLRVTLENTADPGERMVRVTSSVLIDEPVVTVNVTVGCSGKLSKSFVEFVDPPALNLAQSRPVENLPPQQVEPQVAPVVDVARNVAPPPAGTGTGAAPSAAPRGEAAAPSRARVAAAARPVRPPRAATAAEAQPRPRAPVAAAARRVAPGPRLKLDAPAVAPVQVAKAEPQPGPAAAGAAAAAAAAPPAAAASVPPAADVVDAAASAVGTAIALANEQQQRIAALEDSLRRLRVEAQNTVGTVATLESRLAEAESARYRNPVVFGLAALAAILFAMLAAMWWRQRNAPTDPKWWTPAPATSTARAGRVSEPPAPTADSGPPSVPASAPPSVPQALPRDSILPGARTEGPQTEAFARRELSVEELIDLEQQADFFIVLGQDEAAIDLLMGHVRSTGGISPLPYLKLLEIYGRRGEHESYERIRERFNRRFNAYAPEWGSDLQDGRGLEQYPDVMEVLQQQWHNPAQAMLTMDALIFRRDESAPTFELPAYRELLFVYSIARDLTQTSTELPPVDLALPIVETPTQTEETLPLLTVVPEAYKPTDVRLFPVDIDITEPTTSGFGGLGDPARRR